MDIQEGHQMAVIVLLLPTKGVCYGQKHKRVSEWVSEWTLSWDWVVAVSKVKHEAASFKASKDEKS